MGTRTWVMVVQVEENHGSPQYVARFCYRDDESGDDLRNPLGDRFEDGCEYADFTVTAYAPDREHPKAWGYGHGYLSPYRVETHRAEAMVKLLRKVDRGMDRLREERGWLAEGEWHAYALRVAEVLGVREFYVRNSPKAREMSGQVWRRTDGAGVQSWVEHVTSERVDAGR